MIRETEVKGVAHMGITFPDSALAHKYLDGLSGIELGASSHNSFHLAGSVNVAPDDDFEFYKQEQVKVNGKYAEVDYVATAESLPFEDSRWDYVISSHVFEHLPNPIFALIEWNRVVKDGGYIFMIVPHRDALEADRTMPISTIDDLVECARNQVDVDTWDYEAHPIPGGRRGHYHRYTLQTLLDLIEMAGVISMDSLNWEILEALEHDDKVGNGHCIVARVHKELQSRDLKDNEMLESVEIEEPIVVDEEVKAVIADAAAALQPEQVVRKKPGRKAKTS